MTTGIGVMTAKAALIDALAALTGAGQPLDGVQVEYAAPGEFGLECVYGGGERFTHADAVAEPGVLVDEAALVGLYIRAAAKTPADVRDVDARAAAIASQVAAVLKARPDLGAGVAWRGIPSGSGDYQQTDDEVVSILSLQVLLGQRVTYG